MPPSPIVRSARGLVALLTVAIIGVLSLDTTALVAAPSGPRATGTSRATSTPPGESPLRLFYWSRQIWIVDPPDSPGLHGDPSDDSTSAVFVDPQGRLHLQVVKVGNQWRSVQIESLGAINYGTYRFVTDSSIATLAKPLDFAMYLYRAGTRGLANEIDLENSRSLIGMNHGRDAQYVVQPYYRPHHIKRYKIAKTVGKTQQQLTWTAGHVSFVTRKGTSPSGHVINRFKFAGADVPTSQGMHVYIELFLHHQRQPVTNQTRYAILDSYTFTPSS
jgi:hypothetical protein